MCRPRSGRSGRTGDDAVTSGHATFLASPPLPDSRNAGADPVWSDLKHPPRTQGVTAHGRGERRGGCPWVCPCSSLYVDSVRDSERRFSPGYPTPVPGDEHRARGPHGPSNRHGERDGRARARTGVTNRGPQGHGCPRRRGCLSGTGAGVVSEHTSRSVSASCTWRVPVPVAAAMALILSPDSRSDATTSCRSSRGSVALRATLPGVGNLCRSGRVFLGSQ